MSKDIYIDVLYEDNHLIAVNKPSGVLVHSDNTGDETLLEAVKMYIKKKYDKPGNVFLGTIHRLDRPTSGVVVFARTSKALGRMNRKFQERNVDKKYYAIVNKIPDILEDRLEHYLYKDSKKNTTRVHKSDKKGAKLSKLDYKYTSGLHGYHLLEVKPITGRSHQIRVQLAAIGPPIVGDLRYGYKTPTEDGSICLHCAELTFIHPVQKEEMTLKAPMPNKHFWKYFNN